MRSVYYSMVACIEDRNWKQHFSPVYLRAFYKCSCYHCFDSNMMKLVGRENELAAIM